MIKPKKELGQNFLNDKKVAFEMLKQLEIKDGDEIVEIGPGLGVLTKGLLRIINDTNKVYAIEFDPRFIEDLKSLSQAQLVETSPVKVIHANILDWLPTFEPAKEGEHFKLLGSIPYYITTPILHKIIYAKVQPSICVLLVQKEVAQKISAKKDETTHISSLMQAFYDVQLLQIVGKNKFTPSPQVDGAIIKLTQKSKTLISNEKIQRFERFLNKAYANPRKMLNKAFTKEELDLAQIEASLRPQQVSVEQWVNFFNTTAQLNS